MHFSLPDESKPPLKEDDIYLYSKESPLPGLNQEDYPSSPNSHIERSTKKGHAKAKSKSHSS